MILTYWCPTCSKHLTIETDSPIICGKPICAVCNGEVWRKSKEWVEAKINMDKIKAEEKIRRDATDSRMS